MQNRTIDQNFIEDLLSKIREGLIEGVRQEVERRQRLGLPLYIARNGGVEAVLLGPLPPTKTPQAGQARTR
jgi:hypothetical protein